MKTTIISQPAIFVYGALALMLILSSCDKHIRKKGSGVISTTTRSLSESFTEMDVDGSYELYIHVDDEPKVTITTDDNIIQEVQTFVQDGKLFIEMNDDYSNYRYTAMEIHVYGTHFENIDLNGAINAHVQDTIQSPTLVFHQNGSGNTSMKFSGDELELRMTGNSTLQVDGMANAFDCTIDGAGKIDALDLHAANVNAKIKGSGDVYVFCDDFLIASIDGSGKIRYLGNPSVTSSITGSGSISPY